MNNRLVRILQVFHGLRMFKISKLTGSYYMGQGDSSFIVTGVDIDIHNLTRWEL